MDASGTPWPRLRRALTGPLPRLPHPVDTLADRWAGLPARARAAVVVALLLFTVAGCELRARAAAAQWGGEPAIALIATVDLPVGALATELRRVRLPPGAIPADAVEHVDGTERLALAVPAGAVLTRAHLDPRGPAAGLAQGLRAVPLPVEEGWGLVPGAWVDVWALDPGGAGAQLVARSRPVLVVREDDLQRTALVGLAEAEVTAATAGLSSGGILLVHAPPQPAQSATPSDAPPGQEPPGG